MAEDKQRVFIVDDDCSVRTSLSRLLDSAGYATEVFSSATEYLQRQTYDGIACLILDVMMPGMSGPVLHKQLIANGSEIPIIYISAHGDLATGIQAIKHGAKDFLQKPVDELILLDAVSNTLAHYKSARDDRLRNSKANTTFLSLTPRELEILRLILGGATNGRIANFFHISEKMVKAQRGVIMQKTSATSLTKQGRI